MVQVKDQQSASLGWWQSNGIPPSSEVKFMAEKLGDLRSPVAVIDIDGRTGFGVGGTGILGSKEPESFPYRLLGYIPSLALNSMGDTTFCSDHEIRFPYVTGAMANGIASVEVVLAAARSGFLGFFGSAGLSLERVEKAVNELQEKIPDLPFGFNLIHSPNEPDIEAGVVDLYLRKGIRLVEASAYLKLTLPVVKFRVSGIYRDPSGKVMTPNRIMAKVSRVEVATRFLSPPPEAMLRKLVERGVITEEQLAMASEIPMVDDLTAEADSGGHTDNRPAVALFPSMIALRDRLQSEFKYRQPVRIGAAGGISTPAAAAAAFAMGAAYIVTGSVNQSCLEAGTCDAVRRMLCQADQADIAMAPAADMFEMGVKVQVLKRGTMFAMRATKLYEIYRSYARWEEVPEKDRIVLENQFFRATFSESWDRTSQFFQVRDPQQVQRAEKDPKHKMALVFRSYLGLSSKWANAGDPSRVVDYQVWCGPAMGAFNEWAKGSFLEQPENRRICDIGMNLLYGAAVIQRINSCKAQGVALSAELTRIRPVHVDQINALMNS